MKFKEMLAKIVSGKIIEEEKNAFWDCIDNNDDLAEYLLETQIPNIFALMCENDFIIKKPYFKKYNLAVCLYRAKMNVLAASFDLEQLKTTIVPFLTIESIDLLIEQLELRSNTIKTIKALEADINSKINAINEKLFSRNPNKKMDETSKRKQPSNIVIRLESLKKELNSLQKQEFLLVSTFKSPELMLDYLRSARNSQEQNIKAKVQNLLECKASIVSFEMIQETQFDTQYVNSLIAENEQLKAERSVNLKDLDELRNYLKKYSDQNSELQKRCTNLKTNNESLESERNELSARLEVIEPRLKKAEAQVQAFDQVLLQLNGRMYELLAQPINMFEKLYFNLKDYTEMMDPTELASFLIEPIGKLRDGLEKISLNTSNVKILDKDYSISLLSCAGFDDWKARNPVEFDPEKHILMIGKAKQVYIITRGFIYTNNLGNTEIIKAEVRSADEKHLDEEGGINA